MANNSWRLSLGRLFLVVAIVLIAVAPVRIVAFTPARVAPGPARAPVESQAGEQLASDGGEAGDDEAAPAATPAAAPEDGGDGDYEDDGEAEEGDTAAPTVDERPTTVLGVGSDGPPGPITAQVDANAKRTKAARQAIEAGTASLEPVAREICRSLHPSDALEAPRPGQSGIDYLDDAVGVFAINFQCPFKRADGSRYDARILLTGHLARTEEGWVVVAMTQTAAARQARELGPPVFSEDQVEDQTERATTAAVQAMSPLARAFYFIYTWLPEVMGIVTFAVFLVVILVRRRWSRFGISGWVEALNILTGVVIGFMAGLMIWHALPDWIRYGGTGGSTPLWIYFFLPAPLAAAGAIGAHFWLGRVWSNAVATDSKTRLVLGGIEAILSTFLLRVICACVF